MCIESVFLLHTFERPFSVTVAVASLGRQNEKNCLQQVLLHCQFRLCFTTKKTRNQYSATAEDPLQRQVSYRNEYLAHQALQFRQKNIGWNEKTNLDVCFDLSVSIDGGACQEATLPHRGVKGISLVEDAQGRVCLAAFQSTVSPLSLGRFTR